MRFYYEGKQIAPNQIKIEMLEQQRLHVDHNADPGVDFPAHIRAQFRWGLNEAMQTFQELEKQMSIGFDRLIAAAFVVMMAIILGLVFLGKWIIG